MTAMDEFGLIARYFAPLTRGAPGALGLRDDGAFIECPPDQRLVAVSDAVVADVHFFNEDPAEEIARKAIRVNLSDLAAMGARPVGILLCAILPRSTDEAWLAAFVDGLGEDIDRFSCPLLGGDTVATPGPLTLAVTALGEVPVGSGLTRSGAKPGETVWVSGSIGDATLGLAVSRGRHDALKTEDRNWLRNRYLRPEPRLALGRQLLGLAGACIDVSDGLLADLGHLASVSGLVAEIEAALVPLSDPGRTLLKAGEVALSDLLSGGDDYELLFTAAEKDRARIEALGQSLSLALTPIGTMTTRNGRHGDGPVHLLDLDIMYQDIMKRPANRPGYRHFD